MIRKLLMFPATPEALPEDPDGLPERLRALGLLGASFVWKGARHYHAGADLMALITFLGCAPSVRLAPPAHEDVAGDAFCHLRLTGPLPHTQVRVNADGLRAQCRCGYRETDWQELLNAWAAAPRTYRWTCPRCTVSTMPPDLNWRQAAAFGRYFIELWGIYPHEALPAETLLDGLQKVSGVAWRYAYARERDAG